MSDEGIENVSFVSRNDHNVVTKLGKNSQKCHQIDHRRKFKLKRNDQPEQRLNDDPLPLS